MRVVTAGSLIIVLFLSLMTLSMKNPDIEGFSLRAYQAHDVVDDSYDYRGEQAALEARKQTRRHEYVKAQLEQKRAELQRSQDMADSNNEDDPSNERQQAQTHNAQGMSYVARVVAACESGQRRGRSPVVGTLSWQADNPRTTASGAFQFLDGTFQRLSASQGYARAKHAPPHVQIAAFNELRRKQGLSPWLASKSCWGPVLR